MCLMIIVVVSTTVICFSGANGSSSPKLLSTNQKMVRHFLNPRNCSEFYRCAFVERLKCPEGRLFSIDMQDCLNIGLNSAEVFSERQAMIRSRRSKIHRFIDPESAHNFYNCLDEPTKFTCPVKTVFNEKTEVCDWKRNVPRCAQ